MANKSHRLPSVFNVRRTHVPRQGKWAPFVSTTVNLANRFWSVHLDSYPWVDGNEPFVSAALHIDRDAAVAVTDLSSGTISIGFGEGGADGAHVFVSAEQAKALCDALTPIARGMELDEMVSAEIGPNDWTTEPF